MKFTRNLLSNAVRTCLVLGATGAIGLTANVAFAQDKDEATKLDRIEVTGSRIKRADIEGSLPVVVMDRAQIEASGSISVADFLRDTTFNSFGSYQSSSGSSGLGATTVSMRGLGSERTLILIDGRRAPTSPQLGSGQDLNSIPLAAVERFEILSDGASAIYGSDALGGVINIITRKDFDGVQISFGMGRPTEDGGDTEEGSVIIGTSSDRGRVLAGASYAERDIVFNRDRDYWYTGPGGSVYSNNFATRISTAASAR
ncbi:MAG TPA: TonB-dependent receptor plug domain-containing protein, partial [Chiayiivirga sp.]|nr:TonB-dependent receptor plug domain-containing protein [Chiayiivirga sp.]